MVAFQHGGLIIFCKERENEEAYNQAVESMPQMKDWPKNGLFVLECNNENVKAVFLGEEVQSADPGDSEKSDADAISVGETITTDTMEITINKAELSYDVLPDQKPDFYSHYPAEVGKVFIHLDVDVKNLAKQSLSCDEIMTVTADYNGGYTYNGFEVVEDSFSGFTYSNITSIAPLDTLGVHYLIECPLSLIHILFEGVFDYAGQIRTYNITKKEWALNGDTVIYAPYNSCLLYTSRCV